MPDIRTVHLARLRFRPEAGSGTAFCVMTYDGRSLTALAYLTPRTVSRVRWRRGVVQGALVLKAPAGIFGTGGEAEMGRDRVEAALTFALVIVTIAYAVATLWMSFG